MVATNVTTQGTTIEVVNSTSSPSISSLSPSSTPTPSHPNSSTKLPIVTIIIVIIWVSILGTYFLYRWRQKPKIPYVAPRVFVLCSPRNVQFHYELILRVGLPSPDFNPEKHDIDLTILGDRQNDTVPLTRLNTSTLLYEPIITSLSMIVYRLVEMPKIKACILKHSGPFKSWVYVYDFTIIDLTTNVETYFSVNQYIGAFNKTVNLDEEKSQRDVMFPIDDVPLPQWTVEDVFIILFAVVNWIMLSVTIMATNCGYLNDLYTVFASSGGGVCLLVFLVWLIYYRLKWNRDRSEYFNLDYRHCCPCDTTVRLVLVLVSAAIGALAIYSALPITDVRGSAVWLLAAINACIIVLGLWNTARRLSAGWRLVNWGLSLRGTESVPVGMQYRDLISLGSLDSHSEDDLASSNSKLVRSFGPRSSIKSYGFAPTTPESEPNEAYVRGNKSPQNVTKSHLENPNGKAVTLKHQDKSSKKS